MKRRFVAILLTGGMMFGLCGCGSGSGTSSTPGPSSAEEVAAPEGTETDEEIAREVEDEMVSAESDMSGYSVDKLIDLWSSGIITKQDIESKVADGEIGSDIYEEFLRCISDDEEFDAIQSKGTSNFWDYPELNNVTRDMVITDARSFSEGVAWITIQDYHLGVEICRYIMLINTSGEVLYFTKLETNDYDYTNFHNGVSLLSIDEDIFLVNTEGEVIWSIQDDGIKSFEEIYGAGCVESVGIIYWEHGNGMYYYVRDLPAGNFCGYFTLEVQINTFEKTGTFYTVINPDGTMLCEPTEESIALCNEDAYYEYYDHHERSRIYANLFTGETTTDQDITFQWTKEYTRSYCNGLLYDKELHGYADSSGNVIIDCSNYDFWSGTPQFCNGYCVLPIKNPDGAPYLTAIDMDGNQLFSPIKLPEAYHGGNWHPYGYASERYIVLVEDDNPIFYQNITTTLGNRFGTYITLEGEIVDSGYDSIYPFSDEYSLVCKYGAVNSYYFLNADLEDAFPQSETVNSDGVMKSEAQPDTTIERTYITMNNFSIEGKWKSVGSYGFGQAQPGAIVTFDGTNCNFFSPSDTYAFYADGNDYRLECTSFMSTSTATFTVRIIDADHIDVCYGDNITELQRTE